jgi:hypothetical protein
MVKNILSDQNAITALKNNPRAELEKAAKDAVREVPPPDAKTTNAVWLIIVLAFAIVLVGSFIFLGAGFGREVKSGVEYLVTSETILAVFTASVGFFAGLMSPSPKKT